jgi:peptidoglycan hydrolase CwlO-like protein
MKFFRKHQKKIIAVLALFLAALMILPMITMIMGSAGAVTQAEIDKLKENAASLAQQKLTLNSQLNSIEGEIDNALAKKRVVEQEIMVVEEQIVNSEAQITMYDEKIAQEEINLANALEEEALHYENFCRRVRIMEEQGSTSYWQILFNAADFTDLLDRIIMINEVVEYDHAVMEALELARVNVEQAKADLEGARAEQVSVKEALSAQSLFF